MVVEVPEVHHTEEACLMPEWRQEYFDVVVPTKHIKETLDIHHVTKHEDSEQLIEIPVGLPSCELVIERPIITLDEKIEYSPAHDYETIVTEEIVEVPHCVVKPVFKAKPTVVEKHDIREETVTHVKERINVKEIEMQQCTERYVDVPQVQRTRNVKYVPVFIQED